jgi:hypothetical protein
MDESSQSDDLAQLRDMFPDWSVEARWTVAPAQTAGICWRPGVV